MASLTRKRRRAVEAENQKKDIEESVAMSDAGAKNKIGNEKEDKKVKVTHFKIRQPQCSDFQGIKSLLKEIFPSAHCDQNNLVNSLTRLIIVNNHFGTIIKQVSSEDESVEVNYSTDVYSFVTVLNVSDRQNVNCIPQLRNHLKTLAEEHAQNSISILLNQILQNNSASLSMLINDRSVHLGPETSVAPLESLISKITLDSIYNKRSLKFTYFVYICKIFKTVNNYKMKTKKYERKNILKEENIIWINSEDEIFAEESICNFEFSVDPKLVNELPDVLCSWWPDEENVEDYDTAVPYRRVLLFQFSKLQKIINRIKEKNRVS